MSIKIETNGHFGINGVVIHPGSDKDAGAIKIDVTGQPAITWDESESSFAFNAGVRIQPAVDSVTALQALDADGGIAVLNVDTVNERLGIGEAAPTSTLHVVNVEDNANVTIFNLEGKRPTPANNDTMYIYYRMYNDVSASFEYARTTITADDITETEEEGSLLFEVARGGTLETVLKMSPTNIVLNEAGADRDLRVEAVGVANAFFVQGSDGFVGINNPTPTARFHMLGGGSIFGATGVVATHEFYIGDTGNFNIRRTAAQYIRIRTLANQNLIESVQKDFIIGTGGVGTYSLSLKSDNVIRMVFDGLGDTYIQSANETNLLRVVWASDVIRIGDYDTNYTQFSKAGVQTFTGTARIDWTKITADSVTLVTGSTPAGVVADLQTRFDGNYYHIDEVAGVPGMDLIIDFVGVAAFNWVNVAAYYSGSVPHAGVTVQLWNWSSSAWDNFHFYEHHTSVGTLADDITNADFFVPDDTNYIGTGGNAGQVRARLLHAAGGNAAHDHDIDVVALYQ
jgi:hypothetical protein